MTQRAPLRRQFNFFDAILLRTAAARELARSRNRVPSIPTYHYGGRSFGGWRRG